MSKIRLLLFWLHGWIWLLNHPRHLWLVFAPLLLGGFLSFVLLFVLFPYSQDLSNFLLSSLPVFFSSYLGVFLSWTIFLIFLLIFIGAGFIFLYCFYILLSAPFHSILVERVLRSGGKFKSPSLGARSWLRLTLRMFRTSFIKILLFTVIGVSAFFISFIPGFQWVLFATTAAIVAFDCMDYSFEVFGMGLRERFRYFIGEKSQFFLLSLGMALTLLVPGLTFLVLPGAVVGAAMCIKTDKDGQ